MSEESNPRTGSRWLISICPLDVAKKHGRGVTELHGPFGLRSELKRSCGEIASDLNYPDDLVFAAFEVVDGRPVLLSS